MVSERRQLAKRPSFQKQTLAELELSSSIPSFREKKFKKKAVSSKHTRSRDNPALAKKKTAPLNSTSEYRKRVPGSKESLSSSLKPARSVDVHSYSNPANKHSCHSNKQPNNPHSPRAFSLFTLQEYLHERSHIDGATSPTAHTDLKHYKECMSMESSHGLHVSADKEMDAVPLLHAHLQHNYTRKSRKKMTSSYYAKSFGSICECNGAGCKLEGLHCTEYSTGEEHVDDINDEKNEALSIKGYHGCVPWHNLSSVTPNCNKKKMIMDIAGKSFACGGFQVSKRHNRLRMSGRTREACMRRSRRKPQCDSLSSNFGSDSAPLLSDSEAHDSFLRSQCYPGCTSLPRLMRRKLQLADHADMVDSLHSLNFGENGLAKERMRRSKKHTNHRKGPKSRAGKDGIECSSELSSSHGGRKNSHGHSNSIAIENREQHQSLSEKYRPCTFEEMVGQSMISQALSNAIHRGKIAPAYLFQGPRGTGKTCAAKIFAMSINCLFKDRSTKTTMPCRSCRHCESMFSGKSSNVRIVDANTGIGDIKSLSRFIRMGPHTSKYKVLIIDECHMLSKEAWSLFLNIIDQSPIHVVFILITTDTEQLPRMVISKCQKFSFIKIKDADIISRLWRLCEMEGINVESNALQLIACRADGSLFEAETTLDQLSNLGQRITSGLVREMVGLVADEKLVELLDAAMRGDSVNTVRCIRQLMEAGIEPLALMSQLATLITDLLAGHPPPLISSSSTSSAFTSQPLSKMELEKLRQALKILSEAEKQLRSCNNKTTWLTAALLQFCPPDSAFHLNDSHNHEAAQSSSMGTSLTQSPNALLDTSEKETADNPCYSITNVKPPWDISHKWQDEPREDSERCEDIEKTENLDNVDFTRIDPHSKISDYTPPVDVAIPCYGMYHRSPSVHSNHHVRVESESCLQKNSIAAEIACVNYGCGNKNSTQVTPSSMDGLWKQILESSILTDILSGQGKLVSLSVSEAYAIAHLEFGLLEDKKRAENAKASISEAFQMALGCPVEVQLSLMSTPGTPNGDINSCNNGFYGGTLENTQLNQRKGRRRKLRKRPSRAGCCNKGSMSANYYSKHQSWCNSSNGHQFFKNSAFSNAHHITRGSSSDESFTKWTQMYNNKLGLPTARALQKISTSSIRDESKGHVDLYEKYTQCALSGSQNGKIYVSENVDDTSQDLLYDASLRVERDSTNYSHQSLEYDELEYERRNMTPAFRTGFLCWKATTKKGRHESKICLREAREKQVTGCCAS
ncbi:hypothetical protein GOP47_0019635 [Adiantum capillus-veneris]|uniref:AAA+ ATPase domain-containing protein n=1 Tax=Adiantum capillus-veneris TaxID=13818 RepID=A0A9D4UBP1_ADICA|nr:hypothetical protein GOP47_0019635 [Adiantum capillus-veneris]